MDIKDTKDGKERRAEYWRVKRTDPAFVKRNKARRNAAFLKKKCELIKKHPEKRAYYLMQLNRWRDNKGY